MWKWNIWDEKTWFVFFVNLVNIYNIERHLWIQRWTCCFNLGRLFLLVNSFVKNCLVFGKRENYLTISCNNRLCFLLNSSTYVLRVEAMKSYWKQDYFSKFEWNHQNKAHVQNLLKKLLCMQMSLKDNW